jgi:hypothetical protein
VHGNEKLESSGAVSGGKNLARSSTKKTNPAAAQGSALQDGDTTGELKRKIDRI